MPDRRPGTVYLVGAGPGDAGLLTVRGREIMRTADLVLYDGLVNPDLLALATGRCERTARVVSDGDRRVDQQSVNERLVAASRAGLTVCRLKGGDPYIFGRGSEEAAALEAAGLPFQVVPGVTAATACGAYAGFSLTHREIASAVALITGHERPGKPASMLDYAALAAFPGTLVFYMGLHRLPSIAEQLVAHGKPPDTPAAVVSRASLPDQRTVSATLAELPSAAVAAGLHPPSLIVVGECVRLRETLDWFERQPLHGVRVAVCRAEHQAGDAVAAIAARGGIGVVAPVIAIEPAPHLDRIDAAIESLRPGEVAAFTSGNGVAAVRDRLHAMKRDARAFAGVTLACVGESTADELATLGLQADIVPETANAAALAAAILRRKPTPRRAVFFAADRAGDTLEATLAAAGVACERVETYRSVVLDAWPDGFDADWIALSSSAIAKSVARLTHATDVPCVAISDAVATVAREVGLRVDAVAAEASWAGILDAIEAAQLRMAPTG